MCARLIGDDAVWRHDDMCCRNLCQYAGVLLFYCIVFPVGFITLTPVMTVFWSILCVGDFFASHLPPRKPQPGSLLHEVWKAKKEKVCPLVEFTE